MTSKQYYAPFKKLECMAYGMPKPELTWTRDGGTIPSEISVITGEQNGSLVWAILTFPKQEYGFNGNFTCTASNVAGTSTKMFIIIPTGIIMFVCYLPEKLLRKILYLPNFLQIKPHLPLCGY